MSEEQSSFKVTDRRLFNADGTPRDVPPEERPEATKAAVGSTEQPRSEPKSVDAAAAASQPAMSEAEATHDQPAEDEVEMPEDADDPASFVNFLMSIASNAAAALGMMEHPATHQRTVDLELGKHWIDVLGMLQEKTRGNLSAPEQKIFENLLSDLRMQYVKLANSQAGKSRAYTGRDIVGG
jgi:Domain of unknown function (DUF1844)